MSPARRGLHRGRHEYPADCAYALEFAELLPTAAHIKDLFSSRSAIGDLPVYVNGRAIAPDWSAKRNSSATLGLVANHVASFYRGLCLKMRARNSSLRMLRRQAMSCIALRMLTCVASK